MSVLYDRIHSLVALLAEGVDRNIVCSPPIRQNADVALLAEGVDRNDGLTEEQAKDAMSPSSRRAWIEIHVKKTNPRTDLVALLAEGVDRNFGDWSMEFLNIRSPSSRRAWIEIR